jgi:hypothetical protein
MMLTQTKLVSKLENVGREPEKGQRKKGGREKGQEG